MAQMPVADRADYHRHLTIAMLTEVLSCADLEGVPADEVYDRWQGSLSEGAQRVLPMEDPLLTALSLRGVADHRSRLEMAAELADASKLAERKAVVAWYELRHGATMQYLDEVLPAPENKRLAQAVASAQKLQALWHLSLFNEMQTLVEEDNWRDAIRLLLLHGRFSEAEIARVTGASRSTVNRWAEHGSRPMPSAIPMILGLIGDMLLAQHPPEWPSKLGLPHLRDYAIHAALELERARLGETFDLSKVTVLGRFLHRVVHPISEASATLTVDSNQFADVLMQFHALQSGRESKDWQEAGAYMQDLADRFQGFDGRQDAVPLRNSCLLLHRLAVQGLETDPK